MIITNFLLLTANYLESVYKLPIFSMSQPAECAGSDKFSISYIQERLQ
jgi:hypothetical protein